MSWWEGVNETRILIAPGPDVSNGAGCLLSLRHPKSGNSSNYLFVDGGLQELHWFKQPYRSWFIGDYVCEDGSLYTATPVDPVFVLLPIFEDARMKKLEDPGKFRQLDEIIFVDGYPGYQHLLSIAELSMQVVCETKEMGSMKFFRLDDTKVLRWLYYKARQVKETLSVLDKNYAAQEEVDTYASTYYVEFSEHFWLWLWSGAGAVSILGEYLKDEPWLKLLCNYLKIKLPEVATNEIQDMKILPPAESSLGSSNSIKAKAVKSGKQAKKLKVETDSMNIKDMFSRASRER